jgi:hypothetical protein
MPWRHGGSGGILLNILNRSTRWSWVVSFTPLLLYTQRCSPQYRLDMSLGWSIAGPDATEKRKISCPFLESNPCRLPRIMLQFIFYIDLRKSLKSRHPPFMEYNMYTCITVFTTVWHWALSWAILIHSATPINSDIFPFTSLIDITCSQRRWNTFVQKCCMNILVASFHSYYMTRQFHLPRFYCPIVGWNLRKKYIFV